MNRICPRCASEIAADQRLCPVCMFDEGLKADTIRCVKCQADIDGARFCPECGTAAPATSADGDPIRTALDAKLRAQYRIVRLLGRGGMGSVYLARDLTLEREVAIKVIRTEGLSREQMMDAIRKRHTYAATDNIVLDFRARTGTSEHIMGDIFEATGPLKLSVRAKGTNTIKQIDLISDARFLYTTRPGTQEASFEFAPAEGKGESWFYVRVLQEDGQLAWSSPIWVKR